MNVWKRVTPCAMGCLITSLAACGGGDSAPTPTVAATPLRCEQLAGMAVAATEIGLPTTGASVTAATLVAAAGTGAAALPEYCAVSGSIAPVDPNAPKILFKLALPSNWNSKVLMFGGGGFDGSVPGITGNVAAGPADKPRPLARGYATFGSDSGHQAGALGSQDGSSFVNDEAVRNFGGDALKKTRDVAIFLIKQRYAAAPSKAYFQGGSTGGREALAAIQRWPADWDGAIAWYPAWNDAAALLFGHKANRALAQPGAYPNTAKKLLIYQAAMAACDGLDGVVDGLISNQVRCNGIFDPTSAVLNGAPLRCAGGVDSGDNCLSDAQIGALKTLNNGARFNFQLASGETGYPGYNVWGSDLGIASNPSPLQPTITFLALGTVAPADPMPTSGGPYVGLFLEQWIRYAVTRDASFSALSLDPENPGPWADRISALSTQLDTSTDIAGFVAKGGKLLLAHGMSDVLVSTRATEQYYQRLQAQFGPANVDKFARYYEVPGYGHAVSTGFNAAWDSLTALEQWVETSVAPSAQVVTDTAGVPGRTRPLCDYPAWPKYRGTGDANLAASFSCASS